MITLFLTPNVYENIVLPVELDGDTVDQKFLTRSFTCWGWKIT